MSNQDGFSIQFVSQVTGINAHTLRAWEKRYQAVVPQRNPKGKRLYSDEDIELVSIVNNDLVTISIKDKGIGISEDEQKYLFTRFFRAKNTDNIPGTGLGLSIVKRYMELLGGSIQFSSKPNIGSTFTVLIPLNK